MCLFTHEWSENLNFPSQPFWFFHSCFVFPFPFVPLPLNYGQIIATITFQKSFFFPIQFWQRTIQFVLMMSEAICVLIELSL